MPDITIRPGKRTDAADLAILDNLAGHSIPLMFWREQTTNDRIEDALALGRDRLADDDGFYNWKKARVAVEDDLVVGMSISYIMPEPDDESEALKQNTIAFKPVFELYDLCANHWFIDALAVYPSGQNKGVGKLLFDDSLAIGKQSGAKTMSLIVEDTNEVAYALYRSYGFEVVTQKDFVPFEGARDINEWLLMSRSLT
jgi:ribosomal protein S18 acetylase RimI-like enzyme